MNPVLGSFLATFWILLLEQDTVVQTRTRVLMGCRSESRAAKLIKGLLCFEAIHVLIRLMCQQLSTALPKGQCFISNLFRFVIIHSEANMCICVYVEPVTRSKDNVLS